MNNIIQDNSFILKAYSLDKENFGKKLEPKELAKETKSSKLDWIHLDANKEETKIWLLKECKYLDSIIVNALLAEETRPRVEKINDGIFLIVRCVNLNEGSKEQDLVSIRMWIDENRIISLQKRGAKSIDDIEKLIISGYEIKDSGDFLCLLLSYIFKRFETVLSNLDDEMDDVEEKLIDNPNPDLRNDLVGIRMKAISFRRYMIPQRDAVSNLRLLDLSWIGSFYQRQLQENYDQLLRYVEDLDAMRERSQIIKEELTNALSDKINKNMYILSVIASVFLPLTFLTGLLGVNVGGIPGAENLNAFYIFCISLVFIIIFQVLIFRKLKWF